MFIIVILIMLYNKYKPMKLDITCLIIMKIDRFVYKKLPVSKIFHLIY